MLDVQRSLFGRRNACANCSGTAFSRTLQEKGLKEAVRERDAQFDKGITRV
jgi:hypothetical protein